MQEKTRQAIEVLEAIGVGHNDTDAERWEALTHVLTLVREDAAQSIPDREELSEKGLKSCPFCSSTEILIERADDDLRDIRWVAYCDACLMSTPGIMERSGAIKAWNRRSLPNQWVEIKSEEDFNKSIAMRKKYAVMGQGFSGSTDDVDEALGWIAKNGNGDLYMRIVDTDKSSDTGSIPCPNCGIWRVELKWRVSL